MSFYPERRNNYLHLDSPNQPQRDSVRFSDSVVPGKPQGIAKRLIFYD